MSDKKTIAVIGATGAQGGGVVRAILADPEQRFAARAITRKPDSDKARALAAAGGDGEPGPRVCGRVRRLCRHELLGTRLTGAGACPRVSDGTRDEGRGRRPRGLV